MLPTLLMKGTAFAQVLTLLRQGDLLVVNETEAAWLAATLGCAADAAALHAALGERAFAAGADIKELAESTPVSMLKRGAISRFDRIKDGTVTRLFGGAMLSLAGVWAVQAHPLDVWLRLVRHSSTKGTHGAKSS